MARTKRVIAAATVGILAASMAACSSDDGSGKGNGGNPSGGAGGGGTVILGTTDKVGSLDPAAAYDLPSWTIIRNTFQKLYRFPEGSTTAVPDAAQKCDFPDPKTYSCTLKPGQTFSDGTPLTAKDVKFSFERMLKINDPNGPAPLLGSMDTVDAPDDNTVVFHLKNADVTFASVVASEVGAIVPSSGKYPLDKLADNSTLLGSGAYKLAKYTPGQQAVFELNDKYKGDIKPANGKFLIQYFTESSALKQAIENGTVDVAVTGLSPTDITDLRGKSSQGIKVIDGIGSTIRFMTFNVKSAPVDNKAVRQAIAQTVDRESMIKQAYNGTVDPLYSLVANGFAGHADAFKDKYGAPSKDKAKAILDAAGVKTPVDLTLWYNPGHYGATTADEYTEIKRQLDASGLFKVNLQTTEWEAYKKSFAAGEYAAWGAGWQPDFPDSDNYIEPFLRPDGTFHVNYDNPAAKALIEKERTSADPAARNAAFAEAQKIAADDVPYIPLWQGKQVAVTRPGVEGVDKTLDVSVLVSFWVISKK
ncbi:ABC transporter substrate-binding protein [Yinghuangia seranimata]|uniref:ABC transporter substrate-binding protein n=1 Tax=Yinghuangia seranimata TaxID=408067 RepID=UPI00248B6267|nr:ABC transporter substrate-binding protein [Yinghuangia seranimata]MDI2131576.1 ABC transporter substrate-binding protein [Yinghuangia seranimata]